MIKTAIIRKLQEGKYRLYSRKKGPGGERKNLGTYTSRAGAEKREQDINAFKHMADDKDDKQTKMLRDISEIAGYLEEAGFVDKADELYVTMALIDGSLDEGQNTSDPNLIPDDQANRANQGYIGGDGTGGGYSGLHTPMIGTQMIDDPLPGVEQDNVDMIAAVNGIRGNSVTEDQNAGMFQGFSDSYFYVGYGDLQGAYGPQERTE